MADEIFINVYDNVKREPIRRLYIILTDNERRRRVD